MEKDDRYYGSDLNKMIDKECTRFMTVMNIDLIMYEKYSKSIRIIESKHSHEKMRNPQYNLLMILSTFEKILKQNTDYSFEVFTIYGDPPYKTAWIKKMNKNLSIEVNHNELINFLNFKLSIEIIKKEVR